MMWIQNAKFKLSFFILDSFLSMKADFLLSQTHSVISGAQKTSGKLVYLYSLPNILKYKQRSRP